MFRRSTRALSAPVGKNPLSALPRQLGCSPTTACYLLRCCKVSKWSVVPDSNSHDIHTIFVHPTHLLSQFHYTLGEYPRTVELQGVTIYCGALHRLARWLDALDNC